MARLFDARTGAREAYFKNLRLPVPENDGRLNTMNLQGAMFPDMKMADRFVQFLTTQLKPENSQSATDIKILEIGSAYGKVCLKLFEQFNNIGYVAMDMDERHLQILAKM